MTGLFVFIAVTAVVLGLLVFAWTRRAGVLGRGVGAAGAEYNRQHGFAERQPGSSATAEASPPPAPNHFSS